MSVPHTTLHICISFLKEMAYPLDSFCPNLLNIFFIYLWLKASIIHSCGIRVSKLTLLLAHHSVSDDGGGT